MFLIKCVVDRSLSLANWDWKVKTSLPREVCYPAWQSGRDRPFLTERRSREVRKQPGPAGSAMLDRGSHMQLRNIVWPEDCFRFFGFHWTRGSKSLADWSYRLGFGRKKLNAANGSRNILDLIWNRKMKSTSWERSTCKVHGRYRARDCRGRANDGNARVGLLQLSQLLWRYGGQI